MIKRYIILINTIINVNQYYNYLFDDTAFTVIYTLLFNEQTFLQYFFTGILPRYYMHSDI